MSFVPLLVALDIDGTVVDREGNLPAAVHDVIHQLLDRDLKVVLATGRSWSDAMPIHEALHLPAGPMVVSNGAVIVDSHPFKVRQQITFDPEPVIRRVMTVAPHLRVAVEDPRGGYRLNELFPDGELNGEMRLQSLDELCSEAAARVILRDPEGSTESFQALAKSMGMHGVSYSIGWSAWLDIAPVGVNKATALKQVTKWLGIKRSHVLALGDGRNDIEMLKWAGRGVAIGDAPLEVQLVADHVTGRFDDDGTVDELSRWV